MRLGSGLARGTVARREQMLSERARCSVVRKAFPQIEQLRIELVFGTTRGVAPSPQVHTLYPAAAAFFRFPCPCADCDGDFDLTDVVTALAGSGVLSSRGQLICDGTRRDHPAGQAACPIRLDYQLTSSSHIERC